MKRALLGIILLTGAAGCGSSTAEPISSSESRTLEVAPKYNLDANDEKTETLTLR